MPRPSLHKYFPILQWGKTYEAGTFVSDLIAAIIVTIMLIPQSLAYALLAGLPPEMGLYASVAPILLYAIFGTSRTLAVGPVAVVSLLTATALGNIASSGTTDYATAALTLAALSGAILLAMGLLKLGFLANFLSHPVISGFITASGILIAASQLKHILGIRAEGHTLIDISQSLFIHLPATNWITLSLGAAVVGFLFLVRTKLKPILIGLGIGERLADVLTKAGPVAAVIVSTACTWYFDLANSGVQVIGTIPQSLPPFTQPSLSPDLLTALFVPALLISVIGFVESISVAQTLAAKKRQRIDPDQELIGLGSANIAASLTGGFPVTGGFSRSVVNFDAGAETPAAGAYTAIGLAIAALTLTPFIYFLPKATLAGTIIVAVLTLVDFSTLARAWTYSKADFTAVAGTIIVTLTLGVEAGVSCGVLISVGLFLFKTSRPHIAEVGLVQGTEHFRNIHRHKVRTEPQIVTIRIDESLYFANARFLEDYIYERVVGDGKLAHVILMCSAVNEIDMSALESLEAINNRLKDLGISLHLSEVKGPVMDRLKRTHFAEELTGNIYLYQFQALQAISAPTSPKPLTRI